MIPSLQQAIQSLSNATDAITVSPEQAHDLVHHYSTLVSRVKLEQAQANLALRMLDQAEQRDSLFAVFKSISVIQRKDPPSPADIQK